MRVPAKPWPSGEWRRHLSEAVREVDELLKLLALEAGAPVETPAAARRFPLRVPRGFVARMRSGDPRDPLLRQKLRPADEDTPVRGYFVPTTVREVPGAPSKIGLFDAFKRSTFQR